MKKLAFLSFLLIGMVQMNLLAEIGEVKEEYCKGFPSYNFGVGPAWSLGFSGAIQVEAMVNLNAVLGTVVPPINSLPRLWVETRFVPISRMILGTNSSTLELLGPLLGFSGNYFSFGVGYTLSEKKHERFPYRWIISESTSYSGNYKTTTTTYYPITGPKYRSTVLMLNVSFENAGNKWDDPIIESYGYTNAPVLNKGIKTILYPKIRFMNINNFAYLNKQTDRVRMFKDYTYVDLSVPLALDFSIIGGYVELGILANYFNFKMGFGLLYRTDNPLKGFRMESLYMPFWLSWTFGGNLVPITEADRGMRMKY